MVFLLLVLFSGGLALTGFPPSHPWDEIHFVGAADHFARTGTIANPHFTLFLESAGLRTDRFYYYPPGYSIVLGAWLRLVPLSTASLLLYSAIVSFVFLGSIFVLLETHSQPTICLLPAMVFYVLAAARSGFRPDCTGYALLVLGLALWGRAEFAFVAAGALSLLMATLTSPTLLFYAVPIGSAVLAGTLWRSAPSLVRRRYSLVSGLLLGLMVGAAVFLVAIRGEVSEFLSEFMVAVGSSSSGNRGVMIHGGYRTFVGFLSTGFGPLTYALPMVVFIAIIVIAAIRAKTPWDRRLLVISALVSVAINIGILALPVYRTRWLVFVVAFIAFCIVHGWMIDTKVRFATLLLLWMVTLAYASTNIVAWLGQRGPDHEHIHEIRAAVTPYVDTERLMLFDSLAARYIFDFRLPRNSQSLCFSGGLLASAHKKVIIKPACEESCTPVVLFGRRFSSIPADPYRFVVVVSD